MFTTIIMNNIFNENHSSLTSDEVVLLQFLFEVQGDHSNHLSLKSTPSLHLKAHYTVPSQLIPVPLPPGPMTYDSESRDEASVGWSPLSAWRGRRRLSGAVRPVALPLPGPSRGDVASSGETSAAATIHSGSSERAATRRGTYSTKTCQIDVNTWGQEGYMRIKLYGILINLRKGRISKINYK